MTWADVALFGVAVCLALLVLRDEVNGWLRRREQRHQALEYHRTVCAPLTEHELAEFRRRRVSRRDVPEET